MNKVLFIKLDENTIQQWYQVYVDGRLCLKWRVNWLKYNHLAVVYRYSSYHSSYDTMTQAKQFVNGQVVCKQSLD